MAFMVTIPRQEELKGKTISTEYKDAQRHYALLKKSFIENANNEIRNKFKSDNVDSIILGNLEDIMVEQVNKSDKEMSNSAKNILNEVENVIDDFCANNDTTELIKKLEEIEKSERKGKEEKTAAKKQQLLFERLKAHIDELLNKDELKKIISFINTKTKNESVKGDVLAQARSYAVRYLYTALRKKLTDKKAMQNFIHRDSYLRTLGGYFLEEIETKALKNKLKKTRLKIHAAGSKKVSSSKNKNAKVDSEIDIMITSLKTLEDAFEQTEQIKMDLLNFTNPEQRISEDLVNATKSFGVQSKAWDIKIDRWQYSIGSRKDLFDDYAISNNGYIGRKGPGEIQSMWFLSRYRNILLSLGASNVLMRTGNTRLWTSEFIEEFRKKRMLLSFNSKDNTLYEEVILKFPPKGATFID